MKNIDVCLTPELIHLFDLQGKTVVVVDILRATSCMTTAFAHDIASIRPVPTLEECAALKDEGYLTAAERGGQKMDGFDFGNSPFEYMDKSLAGAKVAITTTNGTLAISKSVAAEVILIGSFLNISAIAKKIINLDKDVIIHCSGWKGSVNTEDTLFAGAMVQLLANKYEYTSDAAALALSLFNQYKDDMMAYVATSSHARRLQKFGIIKDIEFCLTWDAYSIVPYIRDGEIII